VPQLLKAAYVRACYLVPALAQCPEDELSATLDCLGSIRELITGAPDDIIDADLFWSAATGILAAPNQSHAPYSTIAGAVAGLLHAAGRMSQAELDSLVTGALVGISDSQRRVGFLRGLLKTCREAAWQNRPLIESVDTILAEWSETEFIAALPSLRLALADLTPRETDRVASLVAGLHGEHSLGEIVHMDVTQREFERNRQVTAAVLASLEQDGLVHWLHEVPQ
jgi:hypothetical protein